MGGEMNGTCGDAANAPNAVEGQGVKCCVDANLRAGMSASRCAPWIIGKLARRDACMQYVARAALSTKSIDQ